MPSSRNRFTVLADPEQAHTRDPNPTQTNTAISFDENVIKVYFRLIQMTHHLKTVEQALETLSQQGC